MTLRSLERVLKRMCEASCVCMYVFLGKIGIKIGIKSGGGLPENTDKTLAVSAGGSE